MKKPVANLLLAAALGLGGSFSIVPMTIRSRTTLSSSPPSRLFGIKEWRAAKQQHQHSSPTAQSDGMSRCECLVWLLPFQASDLLLVGEKRTIVLKDGRFFDLFQDAVDQEQAIIGMALMGDDYLHPTIALCEISDYQIDTGFRGRISIQVTLESVGRAEMTQLLQMKPVMRATCRELLDDDESSSSSSPQDLLLDDQGMKKLETELVDLVSSLSGETTRRYDSLTTLSWIALGVARQRCDARELLESFQLRNVKTRLEAAHRLLRCALVVSQPGAHKVGPSIADEDPSVFE